MKRFFTLLFSFFIITNTIAQNAKKSFRTGVGINTKTPRTSLDINGNFSLKEDSLAVNGSNTVIIHPDFSQIRFYGKPTSDFSISIIDSECVSGQSLIIFNDTEGDFNGKLNNSTHSDVHIIPNGCAVKFIYSNKAWRTAYKPSKKPETQSNISKIHIGRAAIPPHGETDGIKAAYTTTDWEILKIEKNIYSEIMTNPVNHASNTIPSRMVITYRFKNTKERFNINKLYPIVTVENKNSYYDAFSANVIQIKEDNGSILITVSITRIDVINFKTSKNESSNWKGVFYLNILLIQTT